MALILSVIAWGIVAMLISTVLDVLTTGSRTVKRLHQIPCSTCEFFTRSPCLKCTVQPHRAGTELAIGCPDFESHQD